MGNELQEVETGQRVIATTSTGGLVSGVLVAQGEVALQKSGIQKVYKVCVIGDKYMDLYQNEIVSLQPLTIKDDIDYLQDFEEEYAVKCFEEDGERLDGSLILSKVLHDGIWEKLSDEEKQKLIQAIHISDANIIELLNSYCSVKGEKNKWYDKRIKSLDACVEFMNEYKELKASFPAIASIYDKWLQDVGIMNLINEISK